MNRRWFISSLLLLFMMSLFTAQACGPDFYPDVFVRKLRPDNPKSFAAGKLGVLLPTYPRADLAVAFRYLNGGTLNATEQSAYHPIDSYDSMQDFERGWNAEDSAKKDDVTPAESWRLERAKLLAPEAAVGQDRELKIVGSDGNTLGIDYLNCHDDSFRNAVLTLHARARTWGEKSADLADWLKGQDAVFANCRGGAPTTPNQTYSGSSALLKKDRAYQIAAAEFYAAQFEEARKGFEAIAKDADSPWQGIAQYLAVRCLVRQAFLADRVSTNEDQASFDSELMKQAVMRLESMLKAPPQGVSREAILNLRDLARLRSDPMGQIHSISEDIAGPKADSRYSTHLQDLTWYLNAKLDSLPLREDTDSYSFHIENKNQAGETALPTPSQKAQVFSKTYRDMAPLRNSSLLVDWLITFQSPAKEAKDHSITEWKNTHELYWLLAAISKATSEDAAAAELISAAEKINSDSPAWESMNYHRARLLIEMGRAPEARSLVDQMIPLVKSAGRNSSLSLYSGLRMRAATSLNDALVYAPRTMQFQASESKYALGECIDVMKNPKRVYDCKKEVNPQQFSEDSAGFLNSQLSLVALTQVANSTMLPTQLRQAVAMMAWARSVLLKDDIAAAKLYPLLPEKLQLQAGSGTGFHPLMTLLRNPGLRPFLDRGVQRSYSYDFVESYRDNWWSPNWGSNSYKDDEAPIGKEPVSFLTASQRASAELEFKTLHRQGSACVSLGERTLTYANEHPADPDVPESLYLVLRTIRYSGVDYNWNDPPAVQEQARVRVQAIKNAAARLLRQRYAASPWTKKSAPFVG